jgi:hypothetical protein
VPRDPDLLPLMDGCRELNHRYGGRADYNTVWRAVARGQVPAERVGRGLYIRREDIPLAAEALGLAEPTPTPIPAAA